MNVDGLSRSGEVEAGNAATLTTRSDSISEGYMLPKVSSHHPSRRRSLKPTFPFFSGSWVLMRMWAVVRLLQPRRTASANCKLQTHRFIDPLDVQSLRCSAVHFDLDTDLV